MGRVKRRDFVAAMGAALAFPAVAAAQSAGRIYRIGWISPGGDRYTRPAFEALIEGLRDLGYVEGRNMRVDAHWSDGDDRKLNDSAQTLVQAHPDLIVTQTKAVFAVRATRTAIPVVFGFSGDPLLAKLADSLAHPGRNFTGVSMLSLELVGKRMQLLRELLPRLNRVAVLANPGHPGEQAELEASRQAAAALGIAIDYLPFAGTAEFEAALGSARQRRAEAVMVFPDNGTIAYSERIADFARRNRAPAISGWSEFADRGNVISYGPDLREMYRHLATYVDRILKGGRPADLPIELPTRLELVLNLRAAKEMGLNVSRELLARADRVIE